MPCNSSEVLSGFRSLWQSVWLNGHKNQLIWIAALFNLKFILDEPDFQNQM